MKEIVQTAANGLKTSSGENIAEICLTLCEPDYRVATEPSGDGKFDIEKFARLETVRFVMTAASWRFVLQDLVRLGEEMDWVGDADPVKGDEKK